MSKTNCINCGAAKDTSEIKCPFCGTTYLDLTAIDFSSNKPVVCEFVLPHSIGTTYQDGDIVCKEKTIMRMFAVPRLGEMSVRNNYITVTGGCGDPIATFCDRTEVNVGVSFQPVKKPGHPMLEMLVKSGDDD